MKMHGLEFICLIESGIQLVSYDKSFQPTAEVLRNDMLIHKVPLSCNARVAAWRCKSIHFAVSIGGEGTQLKYFQAKILQIVQMIGFVNGLKLVQMQLRS